MIESVIEAVIDVVLKMPNENEQCGENGSMNAATRTVGSNAAQLVVI